MSTRRGSKAAVPGGARDALQDRVPSRAVYYAVTCGRRQPYVGMAIRSIESLRLVSPHIKVYCVLFGGAFAGEIERLRQLSVEVVVRSPVPKARRYFVKFIALRDIVEDSVLFLDADTYVFQPVEAVFDRHQDSDLYARVEWGCDRAGANHDPVECDWSLVDRIAAAIGTPGATRLPLYNTGVMVLNHRFHRDLYANVGLFSRLRALFQSGELPYPQRNRHIVGEMSSLFVFGAFEDRRFDVLTSEAVSFWADHGLDPARDWGVICHTFATFYQRFLDALPTALAARADLKLRLGPGLVAGPW